MEKRTVYFNIQAVLIKSCPSFNGSHGEFINLLLITKVVDDPPSIFMALYAPYLCKIIIDHLDIHHLFL